MTVRQFAERRQWPLQGVEARCTLESTDGRITAIDVDLVLDGPLDDEQRTKLQDVARRCPVSRAVAAGLAITVH